MRRLAVLVPTHNRAALLRRTLSSLVAQSTTGSQLDLIVIDNNCTDGTAAVCAEFAPRVRRIEEPKQGLSHARNTGIAAVHDYAPDDIIAFMDDDIEASPQWVETMVRAFDTHPDVDCVGGRVLPSNARELPAWVTRYHWAPLALQDHGPVARTLDNENRLGLVGANFAFRKRVFDEVGLFSAELQRVKDGIGSTEDHEFLLRLYASGRKALYAPDVVVTTEVPAERLTRDYHRRWHRGHGRFHALMRTAEIEGSRGRLFGVPLHLFRSAVTDAVRWLKSLISGDPARAFVAETRLRFFSGFLMERCACPARR